MLPALRGALRLDPALDLVATPSSRPPWMQANGDWSNRRGAGTLLAADQAPLARHLVRFLEDYARQAVPIASLAPQNEPGIKTQYPGLDWSATAEASFIGRCVVPARALTAVHVRAAGRVAAQLGQSLAAAWRATPARPHAR